MSPEDMAFCKTLGDRLEAQRSRADKLEAQLEGWAELLGLREGYYAKRGDPDADAYRTLFFALNDYGRREALKASKFNTEGMEMRRALEAECDRHRAEKRTLLVENENRVEEVRRLEAIIKGLHKTISDETHETYEARDELIEMTSARDGLRAEVGRLESRLETANEEVAQLRSERDAAHRRITALSFALGEAEDFVITHAAMGDEKLLAVIGTALDGG